MHLYAYKTSSSSSGHLPFDESNLFPQFYQDHLVGGFTLLVGLGMFDKAGNMFYSQTEIKLFQFLINELSIIVYNDGMQHPERYMMLF